MCLRQGLNNWQHSLIRSIADGIFMVYNSFFSLAWKLCYTMCNTRTGRSESECHEGVNPSRQGLIILFVNQLKFLISELL